MKNKKMILLVALSMGFCLFYILTNRMPELFVGGYEVMEFLNTIAISIIAAWVFYTFQIVFPAKQTVRRFKQNSLRYKSNILSIILNVAYDDMIRNRQYSSLSIDSNIKKGLEIKNSLLWPNQKKIFELEKTLLDVGEFKTFFRSSAGEGQSMWDRFKNGIEENKTQREVMLYELKILRQSIENLLAKIDVTDDKIYSYLYELTEVIDFLIAKDFVKENKDGKQFYDFLWELFTSDNFWEGIDPKNSFNSWLAKL